MIRAYSPIPWLVLGLFLAAAACLAPPAVHSQPLAQARDPESRVLAPPPAAAEPDTETPVTVGEPEPLWEIGVGGGAIHHPDYPAAGESRWHGGAFPYLVYRGEIWRLGDGGSLRGVLVDLPYWEFDMSFGGAFAASSKDNEARKGMPDLDYMGEAGPRLSIYPFRKRPAEHGRIEIEIPCRAVASADPETFFVKHRGFVFNPEIDYVHEDPLGLSLKWSLSLGATWADEELSDYIYQVDPAWVRPGRPAYDARGGYMGSDFGLTLGRDFFGDRLSVYVGWSLGMYAEAKNEDSPLHLDDWTHTFGAGAAWTLWESREMVVR